MLLLVRTDLEDFFEFHVDSCHLRLLVHHCSYLSTSSFSDSSCGSARETPPSPSKSPYSPAPGKAEARSIAARPCPAYPYPDKRPSISAASRTIPSMTSATGLISRTIPTP